MSGSSVFSKPILFICQFSIQILLKPSLKDFEHNLRISLTEEPGWLQSMGSPRVEHDWVTFTSLPSPGLGWWISLMTLPVSTSDFGSSASRRLWELPLVPPWHIPLSHLWLQLYIWWEVPMHLEKVPFKNWNMVDLQHCTSFWCTTQWLDFIYIYIYIYYIYVYVLFWYSFPLWFIRGCWI